MTTYDHDTQCEMFVTSDTEINADKTSSTVFYMWGIYEIECNGQKTGEMGLNLIDKIT